MGSKKGIVALLAGLLFILMLSLSALTAFAREAEVRVAATDLPPGTAAIRYGQPEYVVAPDETTTVDLYVEDAANLGGWELKLTFDPAHVSFEGVTAGPFLSSTGRAATLLGPQGNPATGSVTIGSYSYGSAAGVNGAGVLAHISLRGIAAGQTTLGLSQVKLVSVLEQSVLTQPSAVQPGQLTIASLVVSGAPAAGGNTLTLAWQDVSPFVAYEVWRSTTPYFTAGGPPATLIASGGPPNCTKQGTTISCTDPDALGNPNVPYFYVVRGLTAGSAWLESSEVGAYSFGLVPGNGP